MKTLIIKTLIVITILIFILLWALPAAMAAPALWPTVLIGENQSIEVVCKGDEILIQQVAPDHLVLTCRTWYTGSAR